MSLRAGDSIAGIRRIFMEVFFTGLTTIDVYYEVFEQVSREAHTRIFGELVP